MKNFFKKYFIIDKTEKVQSDFSLFFYNASSREKKKMFLEVAKQANQDQRKILGI
jgi:hypothetical protein